MQVKGIRLWCMLVEYVKDNYYARFYDPRYHRYSERHLSVLPIKKSDKVHGAWNVGQWYWVMVCACRESQGQLLCKVSLS